MLPFNTHTHARENGNKRLMYCRMTRAKAPETGVIALLVRQGVAVNALYIGNDGGVGETSAKAGGGRGRGYYLSPIRSEM